MKDEEFIIAKEEQDFEISIQCITCGCSIPVKSMYTFPICKDCIKILKEIVSERKKKTNKL